MDNGAAARAPIVSPSITNADGETTMIKIAVATALAATALAAIVIADAALAPASTPPTEALERPRGPKGDRLQVSPQIRPPVPSCADQRKCVNGREQPAEQMPARTVRTAATDRRAPSCHA